MRTVLALATLFGAAALGVAQEKPKTDDENPSRFGLPYRPKAYPQASPKQALESALAAIDRNEVNYLVAHLLDPAFVDARIAGRGRQLEPAVETQLATLRDAQLRNPETVAPGAQVPLDAGRFRARVIEDARTRAFAQLVRDVQERFVEDPEALKTLRQFYRQGTFPDAAAGDTAKVGLPDVIDRAVFLKKVGDRWYVENRQAEEKAPEKKEPEPKKD